MPAIPTVSAIANITLAATSSTPTAASGANAARRSEPAGAARAAIATTHGDDAARLMDDRPQRAVVGRLVHADEEHAERERRDERQADAGRLAVSRGSIDASAAPPSASVIPSAWRIVGASPPATPTMTGTSAAVADSGATMLIAPTASAR